MSADITGAAQPWLSKMTVSDGAPYRRAIHCAVAGTPNRYEPSPTRLTTVRPGAASLAPTAPPPDQPSELPPLPMSDPGRLGRSGSQTTRQFLTAPPTPL